MTKAQRDLINRLNRRLGKQTTPEAVINELMSLGVLSIYDVWKAAVIDQYIERLATTDEPTKHVQVYIEANFGLCRASLRHATNDRAKL